MKRTSQTYRKSWILKSKKQREHLIISTQKRCWPRHTVSKLSKINNKERILREAREKEIVTDKRNPIRSSLDFSAETLQARRKWDQIVKLLKEKNYLIGIIYPAKLTFRCKEEIKTFPDIQKLREFTTRRSSIEGNTQVGYSTRDKEQTQNCE